MGWPYHLVDLSHEQKLQRRELLDRYGVFAQLSALIPILGYQLYRLGVWVYSERQRAKIAYSEVPSSPISKQRRLSTSGTIVRKWRSVQWWLSSEVAPGWGVRGRVLAGGLWTLWLLFLCSHKTGDGRWSSIHCQSSENCTWLAIQPAVALSRRDNTALPWTKIRRHVLPYDLRQPKVVPISARFI
jgi:hypothetical protein